MKATVLIAAATTTGAGNTFEAVTGRDRNIIPNQSYVASIAGTGAVSATVLIEVSNDKTLWITAATYSLSGTTSDVDGSAIVAPYLYKRANVTAISGTGATVKVVMGV